MPTDVVSTRLIPSHGRELITLMDDYGTEHQLYIPVSDSAYRQARIDAATAEQTARTATLEAYAAAHSIDLSAQRAVGLAKKAKLMGTR